MTVEIRGLCIGEGRPKIIAPIMGKTEDDILSQAAAMQGLPADLVEWRADAYTHAETPRISRMLFDLRAALGGDMPLLFTYRTRAEGGFGEASLEGYRRVNLLALQSGEADLLDVELNRGEALTREMARAIHAADRRMLLSQHDFQATPGESSMVETLRRMEAFGADIRKMAYMPQQKEDVHALLNACAKAAQAQGSPICAISMGRLGALSRIACSAYGAALTFGNAVGESAPGQIGVEVLRSMIDLLHV